MAATKPEPTQKATPEYPSAEIGQASRGPQKKAIATPTRRQAEEARRQRISPTLTPKQAKARERDAKNKARDEALTKTHALPANTLIRDWVDRRWNVGEFLLPVMLISLVFSLVVSAYWWPPAMAVGMYAVYALVLLFALDSFIMWRGCRKQLLKFFPNGSLKGKLGYAIARTYLMRRSRQPSPRVKRGSPWMWPNVPEPDPVKPKAEKTKPEATKTKTETTK
ncbi:MAG: DUF3043 domain-containing protein [Propionibacteriaceae bacterium]|nr:DUF3043 domain-containing protein [Propionibacteriaceae bacterium]